MPVPTIAQPNKDGALLLWRTACASLERALQDIIPSQTRPENTLMESFGVTLRALYTLETAFFPDRISAEEPAVPKTPERSRSRSSSGAKAKSRPKGGA